jgi:hypothetical protein
MVSMEARVIISPFYNTRRGQWVDASYTLCGGSFPITMDIQQLGLVENRLLIWEEDAKRIHDNHDNPDRPVLNLIETISEDLAFSELVAFSKLWIFGIYEILRTIKDKMWSECPEMRTSGFPAPLQYFDDLYHTLEVLRVPLAKHEIKGGKRDDEHHATLLYHPELGSTVWAVYHPKKKRYVELIRREIGDEFLRLAMIVKAERDTALA